MNNRMSWWQPEAWQEARHFPASPDVDDYLCALWELIEDNWCETVREGVTLWLYDISEETF